MNNDFFGVVLMATPFFVQFDPIVIDPLLYKSLIFNFFAVLSLFLTIKRKLPMSLKLIIGTTLILLFFNQYFMASNLVIRQYFCICCGCIMLIQAYRCITDIKIILNFIALLSIIVSIWFFLESFFGFYPYKFLANIQGAGMIGNMSELQGPLHNKMTSGILMAVCFPALLRRKWAFFTILPLLAAYKISSASALLPMLGSLVIFSMARLKMARFVLIWSVLVACLSAPLYFDEFSGYMAGTGRVEVWKNTIKWNDQQIFGKGLGYFAPNYARIFQKGKKRGLFRSTHNDFVETYFVGGFLLLSLLLIMFYMLSCATHYIFHAFFLTFALVFTVGFPLHIGAITTIIILSFCISQIYRSEKWHLLMKDKNHY